MDECDREVASFITEDTTGIKAFTQYPLRSDLIRPIPVRLEPPYPWDCGMGYMLGGGARGVSLGSSAFTPVIRTRHQEGIKQQLSNPLPPSSHQENCHDNHKATKHEAPRPEKEEDQAQLSCLRAELEDAREHLHSSTLLIQALEQKNRKLLAKLAKYKTENSCLKKHCKTLVQERESLREITNMFLDCHDDKLSPHVKEAIIPVTRKVDHKTVSPGKSDTSSALQSSSHGSVASSSSKEIKMKKRTLFKQIRRAFKKMTI